MKNLAIKKLKEQAKGPALKCISDYLIKFIDEEPIFAEKVLDEKKSMNQMMDYILSEAKKEANGNAACIPDETVFGWAVHYFDEKEIKFKPVSGAVTASAMTQEKKKGKSNLEDVKNEKPLIKAKKGPKKAPEMMMNIFDFMEGK